MIRRNHPSGSLPAGHDSTDHQGPGPNGAQH